MSALPQPIPALMAKIKADEKPVISRHGKHVYLARAPGRLDVLGGVANTTGALVCQYPLDIATAVAVQRRDDRKLLLCSYNAEDVHATKTIELSLDDLYGTAALMPVSDVQHSFAGQRHWASYIAGAYYVLAKRRRLTSRSSGANICIDSTIPQGAGMASSAALEIATLSAVSAAYHMVLEPMELALIGQKLENQIVGAPSGIMDQVTSALAQPNKLLLMTCQPHTVDGFTDVPPGLLIAGINSGVKHAGDEPAYIHARVAGFMAHAIIATIYKDLGMKTDPTKGYLANISGAVYRRYFRQLLPGQVTGRDFAARFGTIVDRVTPVDPATTYNVRAAADHHIMENQRAHALAQTLKKTGVDSRQAALRAGRLLYASHLSNVCRIGLGTPETELLVKLIRAHGPANGFYGAKITGTGGTVAVLCDNSPTCRETLAAVAAEYGRQTGLTAGLLLASSAGAALTEPAKVSANEIFGVG